MFGVSPLYGCPGPTSEATATAGLNELRAVSLELRVKQRQEQRQRQEQEQEQEQKQIPCGNDKQKDKHMRRLFADVRRPSLEGLLIWRLRCISKGTKEFMMQIGSRLSEALGKYLDLTSDQMKLTAGNVANVDTPGYKTQGMDFNAAFSQAMKGLDTSSVKTGDVDGLVARPDGNNVSMDREGLQLAKEQLQFRTGVELLKREYSRTMSAIHADGK